MIHIAIASYLKGGRMTGVIDMNLKSRRLAIFERVKDKLAASGQPVQENAPFLDLVEQWAEGQIELGEVLKGYRRPNIQVSQLVPGDMPRLGERSRTTKAI